MQAQVDGEVIRTAGHEGLALADIRDHEGTLEGVADQRSSKFPGPEVGVGIEVAGVVQAVDHRVDAQRGTLAIECFNERYWQGATAQKRLLLACCQRVLGE